MYSKYVSIVLCLCLIGLLYPFYFSSPKASGLHSGTISLPKVMNGDEPHYLLSINSFIEDKNFDLTKQYDAVEKGGMQAGAMFSGKNLDRHAVSYIHDTRIEWQNIENSNSVESQNLVLQFPTHPVGLALLAGTLLMPFKGIYELIEGMSLLLVLFFSFGTLLGVVKLNNIFEGSIFDTNSALVSTVFLSPFWYYSRALYAENIIAFFLVFAFICFYRSKFVYSGICMSFAILCKPIVIACSLPVAVHLLLHRKIKDLIKFSLSHLPGVFIILYLNATYLGNPFRTSQLFAYGNLFDGISGIMFSFEKGLLGTAPVLLLIISFTISYTRQKNSNAWIIFAAAAIYVLLMASWRDWAGGVCYGPRLIVPILPLLMLPAGMAYKYFLQKKYFIKVFFLFLILYSFIVNGLSVTAYWRSSTMHPLYAFGILSDSSFQKAQY